jgi:hypothetical protein
LAGNGDAVEANSNRIAMVNPPIPGAVTLLQKSTNTDIRNDIDEAWPRHCPECALKVFASSRIFGILFFVSSCSARAAFSFSIKR